MKKKRLFLSAFLFFLVLGIFAFFGEKGVLHLLRLKTELGRIRETNARLLEETQRLKEEVRRLQSDRRYIEEIARRELGLVKEGEIIYRFDTSAASEKTPPK
jgi:cell division protein FtsB